MPLLDASLLVPLEPAEDVPFAAAEEPDDFAFLAFLDFFLAFGFASVVASVLDAPEVAEGEDDVPLVLPVALGLDDEEPEVVSVELPDVPEELPEVLGVADEPELVPADPVLPVPVVDEPDAPLPLVPEAPELLVSLPEPDAPDDEVPLAPDDPDAPGCPELGGIELEVPLPPAMPASLPVPAPVAPVAFCDLTVGEPDVPLLLLDCASAMDDTDATMTNDNERRVFFSVMSNSLN